MRLFLFDLDGTLTDSRAGLYPSFRAGLAAIGCPGTPDAVLGRFLGTPLPLLFRGIKPTVTATEVERGMQAFRTYYEQEGILGNQLYPGVARMLGAVRDSGRQAWIVTSKPEAQAERVVALLGIQALVQGVIGAGLAETDTKTELVARAVAAASVPAASTIMLGDRHYDVIGARDNGIEAVGALWGYGSRAELVAAGCHRFVLTPDAFRADYVGSRAAKTHDIVAQS